MSNEYYTQSGAPSTGSSGSSATMRGEFALLVAAFDKLPALSGNGGLPIFVNDGGTAQEAVALATARTKLGFGTIASQNANNVAITGGTITGVSQLGTNNATITGGTLTGLSALASNNVAITGGTISTTGNVAFQDGNFTVNGSGDATKKLRFEVDGLTSGQTRVATPPDYDFRMMSQTHGADIVSASTINLDTATGDLVDVTGNNTISTIILSDGKRATVRFTGGAALTNGTNLVIPGNVSLTTSVGDFATFRGYASGVVRMTQFQRANVQPDPALVLLVSGSASNSAAVDIAGAFSSTYDEYVITISDLTAATDGASLLMRASEDGGSTFKSGATDYAYTLHGNNDAGAGTFLGSTGDTSIVISASVSNTKTLSAEVKCFAPSGTSRHKGFFWQVIGELTGVTISARSGAGVFKLDTNAINAIRFLMSSGNITNGNFAVYGVRKTI